jgi:superfamily I DNA and/or RNA helicase
VTDPATEIERLRALWRLERAAAHERFVAERRGLTLTERIERGVALRDLGIDEVEAAPGGRSLLWLTTARAGGLGDLRIGPGDPVRLWVDDPDGDDAVRATAVRRRDRRLAVMVEGDVPERLEAGGFRLDRDENQATFDRGDRALQRLRDARPGSVEGRLREVIYGGADVRFEAIPEIRPFDPDLNGPQVVAVAHALAAKDVALVLGPPGTGKTRTLVEIIRQAVARGERVLAAAASNTAVDNLAERLVDAGLGAVRLGHPARVSAAMEGRTLDALLDASPASALARRWMAEARALRRRVAVRSARGTLARGERRELLAEAARLSWDARRQVDLAEEAILSRAPVVCATAAGADVDVLEGARFDLVVLDEVTQAPDPIALVALARAPRAVLAGDPHQLPPTVLSVEAARAGLGVTIFERLAGRGDALRILVVQHRMNEAIMAFPSRSMYGGKLVAAPQVAHHRLEDLPGVAADPLRPGPLIFLDTAGRGWEERRGPDDPSTANPGQAERTAAEVRRILGRGLAPADLGVITPYDAQVRALRELLASERARGLEVSTVDGFQGREKEAVVVDLVRSNRDGALGFLTDRRRMNVALTRARRLLLVVGDSATLGGDPYYGAFLDAAQAAGVWKSAWEDEAPPFEEEVP